MLTPRISTWNPHLAPTSSSSATGASPIAAACFEIHQKKIRFQLFKKMRPYDEAEDALRSVQISPIQIKAMQLFSKINDQFHNLEGLELKCRIMHFLEAVTSKLSKQMALPDGSMPGLDLLIRNFSELYRNNAGFRFCAFVGIMSALVTKIRLLMFPIHEMNTTDQVKESSNLLLLVWNLQGQNFERFLITCVEPSRPKFRAISHNTSDLLPSGPSSCSRLLRSKLHLRPARHRRRGRGLWVWSLPQNERLPHQCHLIRQTISDMLISCSKFGMVIAQLHFLWTQSVLIAAQGFRNFAFTVVNVSPLTVHFSRWLKNHVHHAGHRISVCTWWW